MIGCEVEFTDEFETWWDALLASEQDDVVAIVQLLTIRGTT
jgi:hypothetical protein